MLRIHILDDLYHHSSNVAHGVEVPPGARLLFTNGQTGTRRDGTTPDTTAEQADVVFARLEAVLAAANMALSDIVRPGAPRIEDRDRGDCRESRLSESGLPATALHYRPRRSSTREGDA